MQNYGELGESLFNFFKNIKAERGRNENALLVSLALLGSEFECAVGSTDRDSEGVNACACNEVLNFFGACVRRTFCNNVIFNACKHTKFAFNNYAVRVCIFNNLLCEGNIIFIRVVRAVNHNRRKATVDARLTKLKGVAVVEVESEVNACVLYRRLRQSHKIFVFCILSCARRNLKDNGGSFLACRFGYSLDNFHIIDIESADSVTAFVCLFEHFLSCYKCHIYNLRELNFLLY